MYTISAWSNTSPDFGANAFINANGTNTFSVDHRKAAMVMMGNIISDKRVDKAILDGPDGCLTWKRVSVKTEECDA